MLAEDVAGVGKAADYVIKAEDLAKLDNLKDDPVIGLNGCQIEGQYTAELPAVAVQLVEPKISFNTTRTAQSGGCLWYLLDDYLGFASLSDTEYNGSSNFRDGANVIIANNMNANAFNDGYVEAVKSGEAGVIFIRNAAGLGKLGVTAPSSDGNFQDVAINGEYNIDDSLFTSKYEDTSTYYARGNTYKNLPEGSRVLFRSLADGEQAFIGGFQPTQGQKTAFGGKTTIFSTTLDGTDFEKPVTALVIGQQMDYRSHYQKLLPLLATAIYAGAAGITDVDLDAPELGEIAKDGNNYSVSAADTRSGIASLKAVAEDGTVIKQSSNGELEFRYVTDETTKIKVVAADKAGNETVKECNIGPVSSEVLDDAVADIIAANESLAAGEYTADSVAALQEKMDALEALLEDANATEADIKAAQAELVAAWQQLKPVDKAAAAEAEAVNNAIDTLLKTMIDAYNLKTAAYKTASVDAFKAALADAETALADEAVTSAQLKAANTNLLKAWKALEKKDAQSVTKFTPTSKKLSAKKLKKAKATFKVKATIKGEGKVTYAKASGNKKITISKAGKVTVKKGLKKGTYTVKVKVKIAGTDNYLAKTVTKTIKIKVK